MHRKKINDRQHVLKTFVPTSMYLIHSSFEIIDLISKKNFAVKIMHEIIFFRCDVKGDVR